MSSIMGVENEHPKFQKYIMLDCKTLQLNATLIPNIFYSFTVPENRAQGMGNDFIRHGLNVNNGTVSSTDGKMSIYKTTFQRNSSLC